MEPTPQIKEMLFEQFARIGKALSAPKRLELLDLLGQGERPVEALAAHLALSVANTSAHLKVLRQARLVEGRKEGKQVFYRLADESVEQLWLGMRRVAEHRLSEVSQTVHAYYDDPETLSPLEGNELLAKASRGDVVILDVRNTEEFHQGHLPHARSVPFKELERTLKDLPRDKRIVAYCRGPYCITAFKAVRLLREAGYQAHRLKEGVVEWRADHLPLDITEEGKKLGAG